MNKEFRKYLIDEGRVTAEAGRKTTSREGHRLLTELGVVRRLNGSRLGLRKRLVMPTWSDNPRGRFAERAA